MKSFSSQIGAKNAPGELKPFGWTKDDARLSDIAADEERLHAQLVGIHFGRRDGHEPLAKKKPSILRKRVSGPEIYEAAKVEQPVIRHTRLTFKAPT